MFIIPESGTISPVKHLKVVVFPAPVAPSKAKHSPKSSSNERPLIAGFPFL